MNELCWITLQVPDVERSREFWRDVIGLTEKSATPAWVELELRPGLLLALHPVFYPNALIKRGYDRGGPVIGIRVHDLNEMGALVLRRGARDAGGSAGDPRRDLARFRGSGRVRLRAGAVQSSAGRALCGALKRAGRAQLR